VIVIGMWSEPVEGREASQLFTTGRRRGFPKAKCITVGRALPTRGNLVNCPGGLSSAKPASAAFSKYGVEEEIFHGEKARRGSDQGLWMLRSPTIKRENPRLGK